MKYPFLGVLMVVLCGCAGIRHGGAPKQSFDVNADLKALAKKYQEATKIEEFYAEPSDAKRNEFVSGRLVLINIRYIQFVREFTRERQFLDSAADLLMLSLNLAGAGTGSTEAKTILHSVAAGVGGAKVSIDKNYYFEKSIPALAAAMNAERAKVMVRIGEGMSKPLALYPLVDAIVDLQNYFEAGTFLGAINAIQADAGAKKAAADTEIALLKDLTPEDITGKQSLTRAVGALNDARKAAAITLLRSLGDALADDADLRTVKVKLQGKVRTARTPEQIADLAMKFKAANLLDATVNP